MRFNPPSDRFAFCSSWPYFQNRSIYQEDVLNNFNGTIGILLEKLCTNNPGSSMGSGPHHVRVYPVKKDGYTVPNSYILAFEESPSPPDFNDLIIMVSNVKP